MAHDQTSEVRTPRWLPAVGPWYFRLILLGLAASLAAVQRSGIAIGFLTVSGLLLVTATLALPSLWLRLVRLTAGGVAAAAGAVLSLQLGFMVTVAEGRDSTGLSGALFFAVVFAGVGAWTADLRLAARDSADQRARDELAGRRHDELLAAAGAKPRARRGVRAGDLAYLVLARAFLRR